MPAKAQGGWLITVEHHADLMTPGSCRMDAAQGLDAYHIVGYLEVYVFVHPHFKGIGCLIGITPIGQ